MSLSIKADWISKAIDSAEKEGVKLRPGNEVEVRASAEELRAVRLQIARLGEGAFRAGLSLMVTSQSTDAEVMAATENASLILFCRAETIQRMVHEMARRRFGSRQASLTLQ